MGSTGNSSGQHLHFEVHKPSWNSSKSNALNPIDYLGSRFGVLYGTQWNPTNGSFGKAKIDYPPEYGANVYDAPNGKFIKRLPGGGIYNVYQERDGYYDLGANQWVKKEDVIFKRYRAYVNYDYRYEVNVYDAPNGQFLKRLPGNKVYNVYQYQNGFYDLGANQWVRSQDLIIIVPIF